eukprot:9610511-Lingulodinium_polyedra.AAC.1
MALPGAAVCLLCGAGAPDWARLAAAPCAGWRDCLPARVAAWLAGGGAIVHAGGGPEALAAAARRRLG